MSRPWWEPGVIYQIYPRSFQDSNGDGIGDLAGVAKRLDYLVDLGVDAIWLSPIFPSPMADFGYDVADYCDVAPIFGNLAEFDALLEQAHARGLKLLLDFVPNHTSDQHPWFVESRSSRDNARRDWYIWRDPAPGGGPPNNWTSDMGGSSWEFDAHTGQYYLHAFLREQPDLNWRNPQVREAMMDVLRFWFDRGVDGFRIDVLWHCVKAEDFRDNPPNPEYRPGMGEKLAVLQTHSTDQPEIHDIAAAMRSLADSYGGRVLVGELYLPTEALVRYYGTPDAPGCHLPFNFQLIETPWEVQAIARLIADYEAALLPGAWPNWVLSNHDRARIAQRLGEAQARVAAVLLLTLRGTPTLYQGDELGIGEVPIPPDRVRDPQDLRQPGLGLGRDAFRTPMPWDASPQAGFTTGEPWLPLNPDWATRNVAAQQADDGSILSLYRRLIALRRAQPALSVGDVALTQADDGVLQFVRSHEGARLLVALNLTSEPRRLTIPPGGTRAETLLTTAATRPEPDTLAPDEAVILRLQGD